VSAAAGKALEAQPTLPDEEPTDRLPVPAGDDGVKAAFSWQVTAASWVGLVRRNNQDSACSSPRLAGVADGMGGEAAGDLASMVAARRLWLAAEASAGSLTDAVSQAGLDIAHLVKQDRSLDGMGTTVCAALFDGQKLDFVHIGDSRAYRWRDNQLTQLTHDHSFVQQLIDQGQLTEDEARVHPRRSLVMRVVNGTPIGVPDSFSDTPQLGDRYLFCSDGLSSYVETEAIVRALRASTIEESVDAMLEDASAAGAPDNVTIVATQIVPQDDTADATAPQLWGAASAMKPPTDPSDMSDDIVAELARWGARLPSASVAPRQPGRGGRAPHPRTLAHSRLTTRARRLIVAAVVLAVLAAGALGATAWIRSQYYLGVIGGQAAIFRGVPYKVGPWYLSTVAETSTVNLSDLPVFYADQVKSWAIRPGSLAAAEQSMAQLRAKADACVAARGGQGNTTGTEDCP